MREKNNNLKAGLARFLTITGDLMALEALWFVCSLPIITIGPSTCALFTVLLKIANGETTTVLSTFFSSFKSNFKQALCVGAFSLIAIVVIYVDASYALAVGGTLQKVYIIVSILLTAILLITITYLNALIARYNNTLKGHVSNAFKLAFVNPIQTIFMWLIILLPVVLILFVPPIILVYMGWFLILFAFSLPAYLCSKIMIKIFKKFDDRKEGA